MIKDFYCQQKFDYLTIRLYDGTVASCCQANYHALPVSVFKSHGIFNYPSIQQDRTKMLANELVDDCESCWIPERKGLVSRRQKLQTTERIYHSTTVDKPKTINLVISNTCNQTCVYCDKTFSHSWLKDIVQNGPYPVADDLRLSATDKDRVIFKLGQKQLARTQVQQEILQQVSACAPGTTFEISGGEPLLYNDLLDVISNIAAADQIKLFTGLQVDTKRFSRLCHALHEIYPGIRFYISAENINLNHEFTRYGSRWSTFLHNLDTAKNLFSVEFRSTVSNLTLFGLPDFLDFFQDQKIHLVPLQDPLYLRPGVMDSESKHNLASRLSNTHPSMSEILDHMMDDNDLEQKHTLGSYVVEFARRRGLDMGIFPISFRHWIGLH
jgi:hypothetical protein